MASPRPPGESRNVYQVKLGPIAYSGFPVRRLTRSDYSECGEWITAYQAEQRSHLKAVMISSKLDAQRSRVVGPPTNTREASHHARTVLDRSFLLETCFVDAPGDLSVANVSGRELNDYRSEDFHKFDNVVTIDASDNHLPLEAFTTFPVLQTLELSLNFIVDVMVGPGDFKHLNFLDLSYNNLSGMSLLKIGTLPLLRELHLTGNNLVALPAEMSMAFMVEGSDRAELRFPTLEKLWLDDNKLCDQATFATLAGLRKLKYLNLNNNEIYTIPRLKLLGTNHLRPTSKLSTTSSNNNNNNNRTKEATITTLQAPSLSQTIESDGSRDINSQRVFTDTIQESLMRGAMNRPPMLLRTVSAPVSPVATHSSSSRTDYEMMRNRTKSFCMPSIQSSSGARPIASSMSTGSVPMGTSDANRSGFISIPDSKIHVTSSTGGISVPDPGSNLGEPAVSNAAERGGDTKNTSIQFEEWSPTQVVEEESEEAANLLPFPVLETLSLVNNLILSPEGMIACGSWPSLKKVIVYENPFTRSSSGMPPMLQDYLVDQLGINVIRKKPQPLKCTEHIRKVSKDFKKVSTAPPPAIPKQPLPAIEAPPTQLPALGHTPHPPGTSSGGPFQAPMYSPSQQSLNSETESETSQESNGIFITQVSGGDEAIQAKEPAERPKPKEPATAAWSAKDVFRARLNELKLKYKHVPLKYKGYEALLEGDATADNIPQDISGCTRALSYALKHPLVKSQHQSYLHPTTFPNIQGNFSQTKDKAGGAEVKKPAAVRTSYKLTRLKKVLDEIRNQSHNVEANLSKVLEPRTSSEKEAAAKLQKEGKVLLNEMQAHYDRVRAASLEAAASKSTIATDSAISKRHKSVRFSGGPAQTQNSIDM